MISESNVPFNDFTVFSNDNNSTFIHVNLADDRNFYQKLFDYFFDESRLLRYSENRSCIQFEPTRRNYVTLFKLLNIFIDDFNIGKLPETLEEEVLKILADEYGLEKSHDGQLHVRLDKIGKIGEYIFCNLLSEYYGFSCIVPKVHLTTDPNMSVYGIDTLFYSPEQDMILFGESKLSKTLANGTSLINKSLKTYEQQIKDEFMLILSNRFLKNNMGKFGEIYNDLIETSISIEEFIRLAKISKIGIPIFIAHGSDTNPEEIFKKLQAIKQSAMLGLETDYIIISLPIYDKDKMISVFVKRISERRNHYETTRSDF